ncbi:hypothetical protein DFH07DRAFT_783096 [Mycena maculata]|uniref:Uncharacterized protein n=1 Tax=Mycena maculata TaxID=230809 RepID=A0AAD7MPE0_9AGAR|nr:hypothetical protein DFH07DRAFT_783096 [Mycena maculata]
MPQFDQMVEHVLSRKSSVACQAVDPPGIGDLTDLYNVLCNEVPLANSTDLTMALIVGKVINKHRSTSYFVPRTPVHFSYTPYAVKYILFTGLKPLRLTESAK